MFAIQKKIKPVDGPNAPWLLIMLLLILLAASVSFFGEKPADNTNSQILPSTTETRIPRVYTVSYKSGVFSPTNLRIHAGDTVRFKNEGFYSIHIASDPHPDHRGLPGFDSIGDVPQNSYFSFTFSTQGIFGYHNEKNIEEGGTIIVR